MITAQFIDLAKTRPVNFELANAAKSDIKFQLFTNNNPDGHYLNEETVQKVDLNKSLSTKVFIHGWNSNVKANWYNAFREQYFQKGEHNVIYVDWFLPGSKEFPVSAANVKPVGEFIGDFLIASKINLDKIHVIGKSLGAHVASYVGKRVYEKMDKKLARITGLDPASPKFENEDVPEDSRLNKSDAVFVDVVHTDMGYYGFTKPIGTVDFYPNGGGSQPGCGTDEIGHNDSHGRSNWYFLESINTTDIKARKASSWEEFLKGNYSSDEIIFGENVSTSASGSYYFKTNDSKPYTFKS